MKIKLLWICICSCKFLNLCTRIELNHLFFALFVLVGLNLYPIFTNKISLTYCLSIFYLGNLNLNGIPKMIYFNWIVHIFFWLILVKSFLVLIFNSSRKNSLSKSGSVFRRSISIRRLCDENSQIVRGCRCPSPAW